MVATNARRCDLLAGIKRAAGQRSRQVASRGGELEPPFARGACVVDHVRLSVRMNDCAACRLSVWEGLREKPQVHRVGRIGMLRDGGGHAVPTDRMQEALWPLVLRTSATAGSAAEMTIHSNSMACCRPRRG